MLHGDTSKAGAGHSDWVRGVCSRGADEGPSLATSLSVLVPLAPLGHSRSSWQAQSVVNSNRTMTQSPQAPCYCAKFSIVAVIPSWSPCFHCNSKTKPPSCPLFCQPDIVDHFPNCLYTCFSLSSYLMTLPGNP